MLDQFDSPVVFSSHVRKEIVSILSEGDDESTYSTLGLTALDVKITAFFLTL